MSAPPPGWPTIEEKPQTLLANAAAGVIGYESTSQLVKTLIRF
jgi:hypothetical protein